MRVGIADSRRDPHRDPYRDGGAAVVEFVMMSVLLVLLLFVVLQVAVFCYARNVVAASAADAARFAASSGADPNAAAARASGLIERGLNAEDAARIPCTGTVATDVASGLPVARVQCRGRLKGLLLPIVVPLTIDVSASSLREAAP